MRLNKFLCALAIAACAPMAGRVEGDSGSASKTPRRIGDTVLRLYHSDWSGIDTAVRLVVKDSSAWRMAWTQVGVNTALPPVDFSDQMVVLAAMGTLSSGGYDVNVDSVAAVGSEYLIFVRTRKPAEDCGVPATLTQPVDVVRVPRRGLSTRFIESIEVHRC